MSAWGDRLPGTAGSDSGSPAGGSDRQGEAPPLLLEAPFAIPVGVFKSFRSFPTALNTVALGFRPRPLYQVSGLGGPGTPPDESQVGCPASPRGPGAALWEGWSSRGRRGTGPLGHGVEREQPCSDMLKSSLSVSSGGNVTSFV